MSPLADDKVVRWVAWLFALAAVPYVVPVLGDEWRAEYGGAIELPFLALLIVSVRLRLRGVTKPTERRFWNLLTFGFACWAGALLSDVVGHTLLGSGTAWDLLSNLLYLLDFGAIALALEVHPRVRSDGMSGHLRALHLIGSFLVIFGVLLYFLILPGLQGSAFWASSLALFVALDAYIVLRLTSLSRATPSVEWRSIYSWLLVGVTLWGLGDLVRVLVWEQILPEAVTRSVLDLIWPAALVAVVVATRVPREPTQSPPEVTQAGEHVGMGPLVVYAVLPPLLHMSLYRFGSPLAEMRPLRELLVLGFAAVLAAMTFAYQRLLHADNRRLSLEDESAKERLVRLAFHDELTGLPNREMFQDHLRLAIADAKRYRRRCAVLFSDLDHFKAINDSFGHEAGDQVLIATAERLRSTIRVLDTVARFGGDEFTTILYGIGGHLDAALVAEKMLTSLSEPLVIQGKKHVLTTSVGIAVFPDDGDDETALLKNADTAMYQAKLQAGNSYKLFTEAMNDAAEERFAIEKGLRSASLADNFMVYYQPIVTVATGEPLGYEALLRWNHPERGVVAPRNFIDVAEQVGLIVPIGKWVLETACAWAAQMDSTSDNPPSVSVNMSMR